ARRSTRPCVRGEDTRTGKGFLLFHSITDPQSFEEIMTLPQQVLHVEDKRQGLLSDDCTGGRDNDRRRAGGASALDDTDVAGVNFNNYSRDSLMRKFARMQNPQTAGAN
ncbi:uncharacterized protein BDZ99DRAFT_531120, partial [Mytilinidion resinicola]